MSQASGRPQVATATGPPTSTTRAGLHYRHSMVDGERLGHQVARQLLRGEDGTR